MFGWYVFGGPPSYFHEKVFGSLGTGGKNAPMMQATQEPRQIRRRPESTTRGEAGNGNLTDGDRNTGEKWLPVGWSFDPSDLRSNQWVNGCESGSPKRWVKGGIFDPPIWQEKYHLYTPLKFNSSPLKNGGWKTTFLLGFGNFSGASC